MKLSQKSWAWLGALLLFIGFSTAVSAQSVQPNSEEVREDFSDEELEKFVSASSRAQEVQQARQQEMIAAIQEEDLEIDRFNEIMAVKQGKSQDADVSDAEMESFDAAAHKVMEHQRMMQTEIAKAIEEEGITMDTYQQISVAYQQSPKIKRKITKILKKEE